MRMSADLRDLFLYEAFLYYNPLLLVVCEFSLPKFLLNMFLTIIIPTVVLTSFLVLVLQTMMVWLWGINLWVFSQSNVNYAKIFELDQNHLTHREIWKVKDLSYAYSFSSTSNITSKQLYIFCYYDLLLVHCVLYPLALFLTRTYYFNL